MSFAEAPKELEKRFKPGDWVEYDEGSYVKKIGRVHSIHWLGNVDVVYKCPRTQSWDSYLKEHAFPTAACRLKVIEEPTWANKNQE